MGEKWIDFVKRIHSEGKKKDPNHSFKEAMVEAGKRKSEWKNGSTSTSEKESKTTTKKMSKKGGKKRKSTKKRRSGRKSRKN